LCESSANLARKMKLFKKKPAEAKPTKARSLHEIVTERVLTAEGWQRHMLLDASKKAKKK